MHACANYLFVRARLQSQERQMDYNLNISKGSFLFVFVSACVLVLFFVLIFFLCVVFVLFLYVNLENRYQFHYPDSLHFFQEIISYNQCCRLDLWAQSKDKVKSIALK